MITDQPENGVAARPKPRRPLFPALEAAFRKKVTILVGEASMQWNPRPAGEFDSTGALKVADALMEIVVEELESPSLGVATTGELIDEIRARCELGRLMNALPIIDRVREVVEQARAIDYRTAEEPQ